MATLKMIMIKTLNSLIKYLPLKLNSALLSTLSGFFLLENHPVLTFWPLLGNSTDLE